MDIVTSLTEQTTAATDALLGLEALCLSGFLQKYHSQRPWRTRLWQVILLLTATVAFTGAVAHGLVMSKPTYELLWKPMVLCLGLIVAAVVLAAALDLWGKDRANKLLPWLGLAAIVFFGITQIPGATFLFFIVYEVVGMLFAIWAYGVLGAKGRLEGAGVVAAGIGLQIVAAGVQAAGPFEVRLIWLFDHNGIFHLIGMAATLVMVIGAAKGMKPGNPKF